MMRIYTEEKYLHHALSAFTDVVLVEKDQADFLLTYHAIADNCLLLGHDIPLPVHINTLYNILYNRYCSLVLCWGELQLHFAQSTLTFNMQVQDFTEREMQILKHLFRNKGVIQKSDLKKEMPVLDVHISKIRNKLHSLTHGKYKLLFIDGLLKLSW